MALKMRHGNKAADVELRDLIIQRISKEGPLSFRDFMQMALYFPGLGYYTSSGNRIGERGDYYTSPLLSHAFGAMIARQLEEMWELSGSGDFVIVEYGANSGKLCNHILQYLRHHNKAFFDRLQYCIIEKNSVESCVHTRDVGKTIRCYESISVIPPATGCVLSNELVDNFCVHQVLMQQDLMEVFVDYQRGFREILKPASQELCDYFEALNVHLPAGFRTEVNLQAVDWMKEIGMFLQKGFVLTIDYGCHSGELYSRRRSCGTLLCYEHHTVTEDPYTNIGARDITTHVNFSALCYWGMQNGLTCAGFTTQANFLLSLGFGSYLQQLLINTADMPAAARKAALLKHAYLVEMGSRFKVLLQKKGICNKPLRGLGAT